MRVGIQVGSGRGFGTGVGSDGGNWRVRRDGPVGPS